VRTLEQVGMISSQARRTLVKSPPELWAELSDPDALARHLGDFGEDIRIVRTDPETTVEWESDHASGTVEIRPSGWGTKVTLTVTRAGPEPVAVPEPKEPTEPEPAAEAVEPEPEPTVLVEEVEPRIERRRGFFARLFRRRRKDEVVEPEEPDAIEIEQPVDTQDADAKQDDAPDLAAELAAVEQAAVEEMAVEQTTAMLTAVLDRLGAAHHRPFSRA